MTRINHPNAHHIHDCSNCNLLGSVFIDHMNKYDVYECPDDSAIVRHGEEGEYWSSPLEIVNNREQYPLTCSYSDLWRAVKALS